MINRKARDVVEKYGLSKIIDAFGHSLPTVLQLHNYPNFLTKVDIPGTPLRLMLPSDLLLSAWVPAPRTASPKR